MFWGDFSLVGRVPALQHEGLARSAFFFNKRYRVLLHVLLRLLLLRISLTAAVTTDCSPFACVLLSSSLATAKKALSSPLDLFGI